MPDVPLRHIGKALVTTVLAAKYVLSAVEKQAKVYRVHKKHVVLT